MTDDTPENPILAQVHRYMAQHGYRSERAFASAAGIGADVLRNLRRRPGGSLRADTAQKLADFMGVSITDLLTPADDPDWLSSAASDQKEEPQPNRRNKRELREPLWVNFGEETEHPHPVLGQTYRITTSEIHLYNKIIERLYEVYAGLGEGDPLDVILAHATSAWTSILLLHQSSSERIIAAHRFLRTAEQHVAEHADAFRRGTRLRKKRMEAMRARVAQKRAHKKE